MTGTLETVHTVSAVVSVFHNGADLVKQISKKSKKKKGELAMKQKWLLESLESGEVQISQRYSQHFKELGTRFKIGDETCSGRLQHIAIMMQAETLRSLQIALQYDNATLDLAKLQEDAAFHRRDVLAALDELKMRLVQQSPGAAEPPAIFNQLVPMSPMMLDSQQPSPFPAGVSVPEEEQEHNSRMSRLFSMRGKAHKRSSTSSSSAIAHMVLSPNLNPLGPEPEKKSEFELPANEDVQRYGEQPKAPSEPSQYYDDVKMPVSEPNDRLHPAAAFQSSPSITRHASTSTHSSGYSDRTRDSTFSDEKIPVVAEDEEPPFPDASTLAAALPPALNPSRVRHSRIPSSPTLNAFSSYGVPNPNRDSANSNYGSTNSNYGSTSTHYGSTIMSPTTTISTASPLPSPVNINPDFSPHYYLLPQSTPTVVTPTPSNNFNIANPPSRERSNTNTTTSSNRDSLFRPGTSQTQTTTTLVGRPSKANNYWGFCKGSWSIREDWTNGLQQQIIPTGMFNQQSIWRCKHCQFSGTIFGTKKPYTIDPNVHTDTGTGLRYKWVFLAKSHVKVKVASREGEAGFGCLFCSLNNLQSGIFGSPEMLFKHIADEHVPVITEDLALRGKCIMGRKAHVKEEWDINVV